jgi:DNA-directed RNA polymerase subunit RPC12/RpoP
MPTLTCPACSHSGEIRLSDEAFEPRGQWPEGHYPVRKCRACGAGIIVRPRFLIFGTRPILIPHDVWAKMDRMFLRETGRGDPERPYGCPRCRRAFSTESARENHARDAHAAAL